MNGRRRMAGAIFLVLAGLLLVFYPWISNEVFEHRVDSTVESYRREVTEGTDEEIRLLRLRAEAYNRELSRVRVRRTDPIREESEGEVPGYEEQLNAGGDGILCFVEIPKIRVKLPVYHGTSPEVLERGAGHMEGTALPIGGAGNHSVISAHTGVNTAKMFTDLTDLAEGDLFFLRVLGEDLAYRVCEIRVTEPENTRCLAPEEGRDLVSLLTCTPYGINTHRLIVTGERTDYTDELRQAAEAEGDAGGSLWMQSYLRALGLGLLLAVLWITVRWCILRLLRCRQGAA